MKPTKRLTGERDTPVHPGSFPRQITAGDAVKKAGEKPCDPVRSR